MELVDIKINIGIDTISKNKRNVVTSEIYFSCNDRFFPEHGWYDFSVVILTWWHKATINLSNSRSKGIVEEFDFMEGPLFVRGVKVSDEIIELFFIKENKAAEHILFKCRTNVNKFKSSLLRSTERLLQEIRNRNWRTDEIEELEKMWKVLSD
jgi:hypothetical protein